MITVDAKGRVTAVTNTGINFGTATVQQAQTIQTQARSVSADHFVSFVDSNKLEIKISEKFVGERGRVNCSLKERDGFWRWLGLQYVVSEK